MASAHPPERLKLKGRDATICRCQSGGTRALILCGYKWKLAQTLWGGMMGLAMCTVQTGNAALRCPPPTSDGSAGSPLLSPGGLGDLVVNVSTGTQSTWVTSSEVPDGSPSSPPGPREVKISKAQDAVNPQRLQGQKRCQEPTSSGCQSLC